MPSFKNIVHKHLIKNSGYLNGRFTAGSAKSGSFFNVINPANGTVVTKLPRMGVKDVEDATKHANDAFAKWKNTTGKERSKILRNMFDLMSGKYRDDLAAIITIEAGKPLAEAKGEIGYAASFYEQYAEEAKRITGELLTTPNNGRRLLAIKQPVGPSALITPWNFPSAMITRKVGPALAAGCSVLIKPAAETPLSALALCVIAEEAGVPPGVINCLTVGHEEVVSVGEAMCRSKLIRKVSFTGSTAVGKWLMKECSATVKKVTINCTLQHLTSLSNLKSSFFSLTDLAGARWERPLYCVRRCGPGRGSGGPDGGQVPQRRTGLHCVQPHPRAGGGV